LKKREGRGKVKMGEEKEIIKRGRGKMVSREFRWEKGRN
jgi:hypothetical protein